MIPNITRGSSPKWLLAYLFGKGRRNEHTDQHVISSSHGMDAFFDEDGQPILDIGEIATSFDKWYRVLEKEGKSFAPGYARTKNNPGQQHGKNRVYHVSLSLKAGGALLTDEQWNQIAREYLLKTGLITNDDNATQWVAIRHGLSQNGNDHIHLAVNLATKEGWTNPMENGIPDYRNAQNTCRELEQTHPELNNLIDDMSRNQTTYSFTEWKKWAEWKARDDWNTHHPNQAWESLSLSDRNTAINHIRADTMPLWRISTLVKACAVSSHSEDEFVRRVRREGLMINPRFRKGTTQQTLTDPRQIIGYTVTWRSKDGWVQRVSGHQLGDDMRIKNLRTLWQQNDKSREKSVNEWHVALNHKRFTTTHGAETRSENMTVHDLNRIIDSSFSILKAIKSRDLNTHEYAQALRTGLNELHYLNRQYGLENGINQSYSRMEQNKIR